VGGGKEDGGEGRREGKGREGKGKATEGIKTEMERS
jgi:hypothetical protein